MQARRRGAQKLGDGTLLTAADVRGNDLVDGLAKQIARRDAAPRHQLAMVRRADKRIKGIAQWIGRATAYASNFPDPAGGQKKLRDTESARRRPRAAVKRKVSQLEKPQTLPDSIWSCPRMAALRQRIRDRESAGGSLT